MSGCTVHFVTEGVDEGPIIVQAAVPVLENDTVEELSARILEQEHRLYPQAIQLYAAGKTVCGGSVCSYSAEWAVADPIRRRSVNRLVFLRLRKGHRDRLSMVETSLHIETPSVLVIVCTRKKCWTLTFSPSPPHRLS